MKKFFRFLIRIFFVCLFLALIWIIFNFSLFLYGVDQLRGQMHIVLNARPIKEMLSDSSVPDSVKQKINFIEAVKKFAVDSLGLNPSKNYTTFFDQENKPLLWSLTASEPFRIKAYEWKFPFLGNVSYKGFFKYEEGREEELELISDGYDTDYGAVSAWSTLGWFRDPVLSNMLYRGEGQLAELIIHELTHSTIYLKSNVNLNENLASVCGEMGAVRFLSSKFGLGSDELRIYLNRKDDYNKFSQRMVEGARLLDSLYILMEDSLVIRKKAAKDKFILEIVRSLDTVSFHQPSRFKSMFKSYFPNNAYFLDFLRYDAQKDEMRTELISKFSGNIRKYIDDLKERYK